MASYDDDEFGYNPVLETGAIDSTALAAMFDADTVDPFATAPRTGVGNMEGFDPALTVTGTTTDAQGRVTTTYNDGSTSTTARDGTTTNTPAPEGGLSGTKLLDKVASYLNTPTGKALGAAGLAALLGNSSFLKPKGNTGYQGGIPTLQANTTQIPGAIEAAMDRGNYGNVVPQGIAGAAQDPSKYHVKGAMGRSYFSPTTFSPVAAATAAPAVVAPAPATGIAAPAPAVMPKSSDAVAKADIEAAAKNASVPTEEFNATMPYYAKGGPTTPRYLQGRTDGMADKLNTSIDGKQRAKLSHGEFVIPADVVSHLGNGNSDAGADVLYKMMNKVRQARTGNPKQGKRINPEKFTPGGIAGYAGGGAVAFAGVDGSLVKAAPAASGAPTNVESSLANYAGPYVTDMLGKGQALANQPYQAYTGPLTAGSSGLQDQAFAGLGGLQTPAAMGQATTTAGQAATKMGALSYTPGAGTFDTAAATQYMNPYLQASLNPQLEEARRQSQITQMGNAAKATQAGAFGGSRSAIMDAETQRNLGSNLANITGQGYNTAFDKAQQQFNAEQNRKMQEGQFGAQYGLSALQGQSQAAATQGQLAGRENEMNLSNIGAQMAGGTTQRGIESEGIAAQQAAFEKERMNPYAQVQFQQSLLSGLPISSSTATTATTGLQDLTTNIKNILGLSDTVGITG